jgi:hypothetical protein
MAQGLITREIKQSQMRNGHGCHTNTERTASYTEIGKPEVHTVTLYTTCAHATGYYGSLYAMGREKDPRDLTPKTFCLILDSLHSVAVYVCMALPNLASEVQGA